MFKKDKKILDFLSEQIQTFLSTNAIVDYTTEAYESMSVNGSIVLENIQEEVRLLKKTIAEKDSEIQTLKSKILDNIELASENAKLQEIINNLQKTDTSKV
jgi:hypothetical protein